MIVTSDVIGRDVHFGGEFGNQLFQIAAVLGYAEKYNLEPQFSYWDCEFSSRNLSALFPRLSYKKNIIINKTLVQSSFKYEEFPKLDNVSLRGMFQSPRFFPKIETLNHFFEIPSYYKSKLAKIHNEYNIKNYASIHMRYYDRPIRDATPVMYSLPEHYYLDALSHLGDKIPIIIITNNIIKSADFVVRNNIKNVILRSSTDSLEDFFLLSGGSKIAISNSSFSWWASYLSKRKEKIIAPDRNKWFSIHARFTEYWKSSDIYDDNFQEIQF
jgi:hypothetical protein